MEEKVLVGPNRSREHSEGQDREGGVEGPALTSGAESTGLGQGSHTFPARSQRTNMLNFSPMWSQPQLLSAVLGAQGQPKTIQA